MEMKNYKCVFGLGIMAIMICIGCEEPFIPDTFSEDQQIVVEGYVEYGQESNPTFVLLTRSLPFIGEINQKVLEEMFIHNAEVVVRSDGKTTLLNELCLDKLPDEVRKEAAILLGFNPNEININICAYVDLFGHIEKSEGRSYDLEIKAGNQTLMATTTIPRFVPLYDFRWDDPPGEPNDTLATLYAKVNDPPNEKNYYRYLTGTADKPLQSPFASVTNDVFFDGKSFEFILNKAEPRGSDLDPKTFGLYPRGDSIVIKWSTIDKDHFDFWSTLEFSANSNGPFSSYTRIAGNVEGGLGIWGGYASAYYHLKVPDK